VPTSDIKEPTKVFPMAGNTWSIRALLSLSEVGLAWGVTSAVGMSSATWAPTGIRQGIRSTILTRRQREDFNAGGVGVLRMLSVPEPHSMALMLRRRGGISGSPAFGGPAFARNPEPFLPPPTLRPGDDPHASKDSPYDPELLTMKRWMVLASSRP